MGAVARTVDTERPAPARLDPLRARSYARLLAVASVVLVAALVAAHPDTLTLPQALLAAAVGACGLLPAYFYLRGGGVEPVPLLPLIGLFHGVAFGFVAFFPSLDWMRAQPEAVSRALWLSLCGVLALYAGYAAAGPLLRRVRPLRIPAEAGPARLRAAAWAFFAAHLVYQYVPRVAAIPSLQHLLGPLGWLAMGLLFIQFLRGQLPLLHRLLFFLVALPAELFIRFVSGALYEFLLVFVFFALTYWRFRRRLPWMVAVAVVGLFMVLNPVKYGYRQAVKDMPEDASPMVKGATFLAMTGAYYSGLGQEDTELAATSSLNRLGCVALLAYVVERTPAVIPYWGGATYSYFLSGLVPRALWPEKPSAAFGNDFGHRYLILGPGVYDTSINLPWLVEFFVNFGPVAVPLGMALVGLALRLIARKVDNPQANDCEYVLGLTLCFQLFWAESNLAIMWGGLLQTSLALYVVLSLAVRRVRW